VGGERGERGEGGFLPASFMSFLIAPITGKCNSEFNMMPEYKSVSINNNNLSNCYLQMFETASSHTLKHSYNYGTTAFLMLRCISESNPQLQEKYK
jgi:hypothetical protein